MIYNSHRALAITIGAASTAGALWILNQDAFKSGHWTTEHLMTPVIVGVTIVAGHLIRSALSSRRVGAALGFAGLFLAGTLLTLYSSIGRQADTTDRAALSATDINTRRTEKLADRKRNQSMLSEARAKALSACAGGDGKACNGVRATIRVYEAAVEGNEAALLKIGPPVPVSAKADRMAEVLELFGLDRVSARRALILIEPFTYSLFLEMAAIVAFGFGFSSSRRVHVVSPPPASRQPTTSPGPNTIAFAPARRLNGSAQRSGAVNAMTLTPAEIESQNAETLRVIRDAGRALSNGELAQRLGCSDGQASKRWQRVRRDLNVGWAGKQRRIAVA